MRKMARIGDCLTLIKFQIAQAFRFVDLHRVATSTGRPSRITVSSKTRRWRDGRRFKPEPSFRVTQPLDGAKMASLWQALARSSPPRLALTAQRSAGMSDLLKKDYCPHAD